MLLGPPIPSPGPPHSDAREANPALGRSPLTIRRSRYRLAVGLKLASHLRIEERELETGGLD